MSASPRTVLGIDASTQSLSAVLLNSSNGEILWSRSLAYRDDPRLLELTLDNGAEPTVPRTMQTGASRP